MEQETPVNDWHRWTDTSGVRWRVRTVIGEVELEISCPDGWEAISSHCALVREIIRLDQQVTETEFYLNHHSGQVVS